MFAFFVYIVGVQINTSKMQTAKNIPLQGLKFLLLHFYIVLGDWREEKGVSEALIFACNNSKHKN